MLPEETGFLTEEMNYVLAEVWVLKTCEKSLIARAPYLHMWQTCITCSCWSGSRDAVKKGGDCTVFSPRELTKIKGKSSVLSSLILVQIMSILAPVLS